MINDTDNGTATDNQLVTEERLKVWSGYDTTGLIINWLRKNRIRFFFGNKSKDRICTTMDAINGALLPNNNTENINFTADG